MSTTSIPMDPSRMAVPPPLRQDIRDADTVVGWTHGTAFGFLGFGHEDDAVNAAWVAYRTMARRFASQSGGRLLPIDTEPLSLRRSGDAELILAGGRPIATLVRPGADSPSGPDSFGFELRLPLSAGPRAMRSTTHLVYRTLRRSGIRWTMWMPQPVESGPTASGPTGVAVAGADAHDPGAGAGVHAPRAVPPFAIGTVAIVAAMLLTIALPALTLRSVVYVLGAGVALVALAASVSLVRLVVTDLRDALRGRAPEARPAPRRSGILEELHA